MAFFLFWSYVIFFSASMIFVINQYHKVYQLKRQVQRSWIECKWKIETMNKKLEEKERQMKSKNMVDINIKTIDDRLRMYTFTKKHKINRAVA